MKTVLPELKAAALEAKAAMAIFMAYLPTRAISLDTGLPVDDPEEKKVYEERLGRAHMTYGRMAALATPDAILELFKQIEEATS